MKNIVKVIAIVLIIMTVLACAASAEELTKKEIKAQKEMLNADRKVEIEAQFEGELNYGDKVTLKANLEGYENCEYTIKWQSSKDNENWENVGCKGETFSFTVTEENADLFYSAVVVITEVH